MSSLLPQDSVHAQPKAVRPKKFVCDLQTAKPIPIARSVAGHNAALAAEWDKTKNGWGPEQIMAGSGYHAYWTCIKKRHSWSASILSRKNGNGCPYCSRHILSPDQSLAVRYPDIAKQYDSSRRNPVPSSALATQSGVYAFFECNGNEKHIYQRRVCDEVNRRSPCPYCNHDLPSKEYNLATEAPHLAEQWSPRNTTKPHEYLPQSSAKVWWTCGHLLHPEWQATIGSRFAGRGCPQHWKERKSDARHQWSVREGNTLALVDPELGKQLRGGARPEEVCAGSHVKHSWECGCLAHYSTSPNSRYYHYTDCCPKCETRRHKSRIECALFVEVAEFFPDAKSGAMIEECSCDITLPRFKLIIEYDGEYWHRKIGREDQAKSAKLLAAGWKVLRVRECPLPLMGAPGIDEISFDRGPSLELRSRVPGLASTVMDYILTQMPLNFAARDDLVAQVAQYKAAGEMRAWPQYREMARHMGLPSFDESVLGRFPEYAKLIIDSPPGLAGRLWHGSHEKVNALCPECLAPRTPIAVNKLVRGQTCMPCFRKRLWKKRRAVNVGSRGVLLLDLAQT